MLDSDGFDIIFKIFDNLGALGLLLFNIFAFYKGWITPIGVQNKLDVAHNAQVAEIIARHVEVMDLLKTRITVLEQLLEEREARAEQGVRMLSMYVEAQDTLSKLADHLNERPTNE